MCISATLSFEGGKLSEEQLGGCFYITEYSSCLLPYQVPGLILIPFQRKAGRK